MFQLKTFAFFLIANQELRLMNTSNLIYAINSKIMVKDLGS